MAIVSTPETISAIESKITAHLEEVKSKFIEAVKESISNGNYPQETSVETFDWVNEFDEWLEFYIDS